MRYGDGDTPGGPSLALVIMLALLLYSLYRVVRAVPQLLPAGTEQSGRALWHIIGFSAFAAVLYTLVQAVTQ